MSIQPSQKVTWTEITGKGRSVEMKTVEGEVVSVAGNVALVKRANGRRKHILVKHLTPADKPTELTTVVKKVIEQARLRYVGTATPSPDELDKGRT